MDCSVIICTHNPRSNYLHRVLEALRAQTMPREQWELLLIDNASKEPLGSKWDLSWHPNSRHIREEELGLTPARLRGIQESTADVLIFVDDDNVLQSDYLEVVCSLAQEYANLGCFGAGILEPEFEREPEPDLMQYTKSLALRCVAEPQWSNVPMDSIIPWGAGLAIRRAVAERYRAIVEKCPIRKQLDRNGQNLNSGGDDEFSWVACELGFGKGLFPKLKITHLIDQRRVEKQYLLNLTKGHAFSRTLLHYIHNRPVYSPERISALKDIIGNLFRGKLSTALHHTNLWWFGRHKPLVEKLFDEAWRQGVQLGERHLKAQRQSNGDI